MYIRRKRQDGVQGNTPEIQAISELFNRPIEVFSPENGSTPLNIFHAEYKTDDAPIRLSYHDGNHYNAVIDPLVPTAGLGLGLPGLQLGLADKLQLAKAVAESDATADEMELARALKESDDDELQRALKESQLSTEHVRTLVVLRRDWVVNSMPSDFFLVRRVEAMLPWHSQMLMPRISNWNKQL
jgi:OTU domain-containing protein 5